MTFVKDQMVLNQPRKLIVGIRFDIEGKELLAWAIVKVAEPHDHVVVLHVCRNSNDALKEKIMLDEYLEIFQGLCDIKKVKLTGKILPGDSVRKSIVRKAKSCGAVGVILGISKHGSIGGRISTARYCAKHLPLTTEIFTVHNGKVAYQRLSNEHPPGLYEDPRPSFHKPKFRDSEMVSESDTRSLKSEFDSKRRLYEDPRPSFHKPKFRDSEMVSESDTRSLKSESDSKRRLYEDPRPSFHKPKFRDSEMVSKSDTRTLKSISDSKRRSYEDPRPNFHKPKFRDSDARNLKSESDDSKRSTNPVRTGSFNNFDSISEQKLGWPLLRRVSLPTQKVLDSRKMSLIQWVMSFPDRSPPETPSTASSFSNRDSSSSKSESPLERDNDSGSGSSSNNGEFSRKNCQSIWNEMLDQTPPPTTPGFVPFDSNFLDFTWFSYEVLRLATSNFSSENLIGKGGCSRVYKGIFRDGKEVAVKVLKSSKEAWKDFSFEVNIMSSLRHKNITPLLGVCVDNSELISVYEFMSKGSLEDNLHAENKEKSALLSWDIRFKVAVGIAEALVYLHQGCSRPVIHRDVKTSNILLSDNFEPQLSDFGLAIWGPNSSSSETYTDVVGTFGYLAPEYFMYGKVTDKLDVYSFGVVILELLTGRKPIDSSKGQKSLVMWAKPRLQSGKIIKEILDPSLEGVVEESQIQRMVLAATLCLTRATRRRPSMDQILKLLQGEESLDTWAKSQLYEDQEGESLNMIDDEVYHNISAKESHMSLALLDLDDDFTSNSSGGCNTSPRTLRDFLFIKSF